jgi:AcrR family transcriptional regulator
MSCVPACAVCERMRRAALELVGGGGIEAVSLEAIATQAGIAVQEAAGHYRTAAECLYETYDEVSASVMLDMADAFTQGDTWEAGFARARQRLLNRVMTRPAEARLCFVEVDRGDRELRLRHQVTRQWIVDFLTREYERRTGPEPLPALQIELLITAGFHAISGAVSGAADAAGLEPQLAGLAEAMGSASS